MCGIVGVLQPSPPEGQHAAAPVREEILLRMRDAMTHRGPDDAGAWISPDGSVGLAHRRLSIIDLSDAARQPMSNEDGSLWITFNGEIYNHEALRRELERLGHRYTSHADTESILHAYEEWGVDAIQRLQGMFAFALWDGRRRHLWLARDRLGKKPLYFTLADGALLFASEIKALLKHPSVRPKLGEEALWHALTYAVAPAPLTLFEGIWKLPPATHLIVPQPEAVATAESSGGTGWTFTEYWRPWAATESPHRSMEDYADEVRATFKAAVERRLMSDVPFGVFLSGGVDSSANVAFMSQAMDRPVNTFSVGFADASQAAFDEIEGARRMAALFKTNHHEVLISDRHFFDFAHDLAWQQDEPLSDPVCFPLYHVARLAREHQTVVIQVGEGSDEIFAGYEIYRNYLRRQRLYWKPFQALPSGLRHAAARWGGRLLHGREKVHLQRAAAGEPVFLGAALAFYDLEKNGLRRWSRWDPSAGLAAQSYAGGNPSFALLRRIFPSATVAALPVAGDIEKADFLKKMIAWECHQRLGELLLMRLDKMMMAHGVEGRAPFLDTELVELAMRMPSAFKISHGVGKAVLKQALASVLPHDLIARRKVGFCGGSGNMLTPAILDFAEKRILETLPAHEWRREALERLVADQRAGRGENSFQIWNLMNLALWLKRWF